MRAGVGAEVGVGVVLLQAEDDAQAGNGMFRGSLAALQEVLGGPKQAQMQGGARVRVDKGTGDRRTRARAKAR